MRKYELKLNDDRSIGTVVIDNIIVSVKLVGEVLFKDIWEGFVEIRDESQKIYKYLVTIKNKVTNNEYSYNFYDSIFNYNHFDIFPLDLADSILEDLAYSYEVSEDRFPTFEEYAFELGYDIDNDKHRELYKKSIATAKNLRLIVPPKTIEKITA